MVYLTIDMTDEDSIKEYYTIDSPIQPREMTFDEMTMNQFNATFTNVQDHEEEASELETDISFTFTDSPTADETATTYVYKKGNFLTDSTMKASKALLGLKYSNGTFDEETLQSEVRSEDSSISSMEDSFIDDSECVWYNYWQRGGEAKWIQFDSMKEQLKWLNLYGERGTEHWDLDLLQFINSQKSNNTFETPGESPYLLL